MGTAYAESDLVVCTLTLTPTPTPTPRSSFFRQHSNEDETFHSFSLAAAGSSHVQKILHGHVGRVRVPCRGTGLQFRDHFLKHVLVGL